MDVKLCEEVILKILMYKYFDNLQDATNLSEAKSGVVTLFYFAIYSISSGAPASLTRASASMK